MKKKSLIKILITCLIIIALLTIFIFIPLLNKYKERKAYEEEQEKIKNATVIVNLKEDRSIPFYTNNIRISDFINDINGKIIDDKVIDTEVIGEQTIEFEYINDENIKIPYSFKIKVVDVTPPSVWVNNNYTIYTGYQGDVSKDITCIDDYYDHPSCYIEGTYDKDTPGTYPVQYIAEDNSGNKTVKNLNIIVKDRPQSTTNNEKKPVEQSKTMFSDIVSKYKNDNTKIGIDVSGWQGEIDFEKVKEAGVEFAFIKVGGTIGINGEYYVDSKFIRNIEGFNRVGIPVGVYIYSYVKDASNAVKDANWVTEQIKPYKIDLPVVYDWENWSTVKEFDQSFYSLTKNARTFLDTMKKNGYDGALYSSKNYLEKAWLKIDYDIWLAHYTEQTSYKGDYKYWQLCDDGIIDGINGYVDIDIMYLNK